MANKLCKLLLLLICLLCAQQIPTVYLWSNHDISSLELLQVVHRHGDRNPENWFPNDPYLNLTKYWPEGDGQLSKDGKYRMYRLGQTLRREYGSYLGSGFSPREVYARSSAKQRCLESVSLLLAGAYPPNNTLWQWNRSSTESQLGSVWQPIPIDTFIPMDEDRVLRLRANCPAADADQARVLSSDPAVQAFQRERQFLDQLSQFVGTEFKTLNNINDFYDTLSIEFSHNYLWSTHHRWSPEFEKNVLTRLRPFVDLYWDLRFNSTLLQRIRGGPLVDELVKNIRNYQQNRESRKIFVYSTHDTLVDVLMQTLDVYNHLLVPFGSALLIELHRNLSTGANTQHFVRLYYYNETLDDNSSPYLLHLPECDARTDCPLDRFYDLTRQLIPEDWQHECGIHITDDSSSMSYANITLLVLNAVMLMALIVVLIYLFCCSRRRPHYQLLS
ncbi:prostatic acid phosphatase-like [Oppia nitens]|uniref:prostatic acid phosphatase-like n=1 Tax=Oppia nitens TaxID=1686743 RepID=UPI0023DA868F|nr:prostatic acid phosphatase-like [Oppia nitens]